MHLNAYLLCIGSWFVDRALPYLLYRQYQPHSTINQITRCLFEKKIHLKTYYHKFYSSRVMAIVDAVTSCKECGSLPAIGEVERYGTVT